MAEAEAIAELMRCEIGSPRFGSLRRHYSRDCRTGASGCAAALTHADLARVLFIDYPYWNALSGGRRSPERAAERIRGGMRAQGPAERSILNMRTGISMRTGIVLVTVPCAVIEEIVARADPTAGRQA